MGKISAYRDAKQVAKNERKFDFVESHRRALKTAIDGLGKISNMDCIVKVCANICCVITALFDVRTGNPVPLLYSVCIKTIEVIKHPKFIKWHNDVNGKVAQLPYIFVAQSFVSTRKFFDQFGEQQLGQAWQWWI